MGPTPSSDRKVFDDIPPRALALVFDEWRRNTTDGGGHFKRLPRHVTANGAKWTVVKRQPKLKVENAEGAEGYIEDGPGVIVLIKETDSGAQLANVIDIDKAETALANEIHRLKTIEQGAGISGKSKDYRRRANDVLAFIFERSKKDLAPHEAGPVMQLLERAEETCPKVLKLLDRVDELRAKQFGEDDCEYVFPANLTGWEVIFMEPA